MMHFTIRDISLHKLTAAFILTGLIVIVPFVRAVYADPLTNQQLEEVSQWPNWVASSCDASTASDASLSGDTTGVQVINFLKEKGLNDVAISSIVGNMTEESIGIEPERLQGHVSEKRPAESLSSSEAQAGWGIVQWTPAAKKILDAAKRDGSISKANSLSYQLAYFWKEFSGGYKSTLKAISESSTPEDGAEAFRAGYEKGDPNPSRQAYARAYYNLITKQTPLPSSVPTVTASGSAGSQASTDPSTTTDTNSVTCGGDSTTTTTGNCAVTAPVYGSVHGSGNEYTQQQLTALFGDPGTDSSHPDIDKNLVSVNFNGHTVQVHKLAAGCLRAVAADIKSQNISYKIKEMGCYRFDSDNGGSNIGLKSYHTYGVACDINWDDNPFVGNGASAPHDMPEAYIKAFHDHGFTWGGDWVSVKDYMHFEFNGLAPKD